VGHPRGVGCLAAAAHGQAWSSTRLLGRGDRDRHLLRLAFGRPWRQTEGLLRSITALLGASVGVPDHTTFARRSPGLELAAALARAQATGSGPVDVVIDATGLKVHGAGEWLTEAHGTRGKRTWRKLHLAVDPGTGEILACELTSSEEGDASQVGSLLDQVPAPLGSVIADGAYDGEPVYRAVNERQSDPPVAVVIPPRSTTVPGPGADTAPSQRDEHLRLMRERGARTGWQRAVGYGRRAQRDGDVQVQSSDRSRSSRPDSARPEDRGTGRLLSAQPHDPARQAGVAAHRLTAPPIASSRPPSDFCTKAPPPSPASISR
jgi:Transposase DDE domain